MTRISRITEPSASRRFSERGIHSASRRLFAKWLPGNGDIDLCFSVASCSNAFSSQAHFLTTDDTDFTDNRTVGVATIFGARNSFRFEAACLQNGFEVTETFLCVSPFPLLPPVQTLSHPRNPRNPWLKIPFRVFQN